MTMKYVVTVMAIAGLSLFLVACEPQKDVVYQTEVKKLPVKQELMVVKPTLESLDKRVSNIEARNAAVDARARAAKVKHAPVLK